MAYNKEYPVANSELEKDSIFEYTKRQEDRIENEFSSIIIPKERVLIDNGGNGFYIYEEFSDGTFSQTGVAKGIVSQEGYLGFRLHKRPKLHSITCSQSNARERDCLVNGYVTEQRVETFSYRNNIPLNGVGVAVSYRVVGTL